MFHDLYVAIFDEARTVTESLEQALAHQPGLANCLSSLTIFHRAAEDKVDVGVVSTDEGRKVLQTHSRRIDSELLIGFLPKQASWTVVASSSSVHFPETILSSRFADYLKVMVPPGTSSVFFIPPSKAIAGSFVELLRAKTSIIMRTAMSVQDVEMLRASLVKTR